MAKPLSQEKYDKWRVKYGVVEAPKKTTTKANTTQNTSGKSSSTSSGGAKTEYVGNPATSMTKAEADMRSSSASLDKNNKEKKYIDVGTESKKAYSDTKEKLNSKTTITSNLSEEERKTRIKEIKSEMSEISSTMSGLSRAKAYGTSKYLEKAEADAKTKYSKLSDELKELERVGEVTTEDMLKWKIDDAKEKVSSAQQNVASYGQRPSIDRAEDWKNANSELYNARKELEGLERQKTLYGDISKYGNVVNDDDFIGQWKSNYRSKELYEDKAKAFNIYADNPTEENLELALAYEGFVNQYMKNNENALDDEGQVLPLLSDNFASYLAQLKGSAGKAVPLGVAGAAVGMLGGAAGAKAGWTVGYSLGTGLNSYEVIRGSMFSELLSYGLDEETARELATDDAIVESLIESGETAKDWALMLYGGISGKSTKIASKLKPKALNKVAEVAAKYAAKPLAKLGLDITKGTAINAGTEYLEEGIQGATSRATREKAWAMTDKEIGQYGEGNVDLYNRPVLKNADGSISTVDSITYTIDGKYILLPTIVRDENGKPKRLTTDEEILAHYKKTGEYLGEFDSLEESNLYANRLHNAQAYRYSDNTSTDADDNVVWGGTKVIADAIFGGNTEARQELHEQGKEGFKTGLVAGSVQGGVRFVVSSFASAKTIQEQNEIADAVIEDEESLNALIEEGKASGKGTVSEKIATEIETTKENGKKVSRDQVKRLIASNEVYINEEQNVTVQEPETKKTEARTAEVPEGIKTLEQAAMEVVQSREAAQKSRQVTVADVKNATKFGDSGSVLVAKLVNEDGLSFEQATSTVDTAYRAGMTGLDISQVNLATNVQKLAFRAGADDRVVQDRIKQAKSEKASVYNTGFTENEYSAQLSPDTKEVLSIIAEDLKMDVKMVDQIIADYVKGKPRYANASHEDGVMRIASASDSVVFTASIHESFHRMIQLDPQGTGSLMNWLYEDAEQNAMRLKVGYKGVSSFEQTKNSYDGVKGMDNTIDFVEEVAAKHFESIITNPEKFIELRKKIDAEPQMKSKWDEFVETIKKVLEDIWAAITRSTLSLEQKRQAQAEIEQVEKLFMDAYRGAMKAAEARAIETKVSKSTDSESGMKFALSEDAEAEITKVLDGKNTESEIKLTNGSPEIMLGHKGVKNLPMTMIASHIRENILTEAEAKAKGLRVDKNINYHGLGKSLFLEVIGSLDNVVEAYRGTPNAQDTARRENYFLLITQHTDKEGNTINVPVFINEKGLYNRMFIDTNKIATVFGRSELRNYITRQIQEGNLVRIKKRSSQASESASPIDAHYGKGASNKTVPQNPKSVKRQLSLKSSFPTDGMTESEIENAQNVISSLKTYAMSSKYVEGFASYTAERLESVLADSSSKTEIDFASSYITWVEPIDFVYATTTNEQSREKLREEAGQLDIEKLRKETQPIHLTVDFETGEITGHEGRHRMLALQQAGINKVVVVIDAINNDRQNTKPIEMMHLKGQEFAKYHKGTDMYLHNMLPLSKRYADTARELFANKPKSGIRFSLKDSEGNALTKEQAEFFKDSKVRDENGNLLVVYHGSPSKFTVFNHKYLNVHGNSHGRGFYFTEKRSLAEGYERENGQLLKGYLNVTNPLSEDKVTIKKADFLNLIKATCKEEAQEYVNDGDYDSVSEAIRDTWISNYVNTYETSMDNAYREAANVIYSGNTNDVEMIAELTNASRNDIVLKLTRDILGYDGVIYMADDGTHEFVSLTSEQFKSVTNTAPTSDPDIRYSLKDSEGKILTEAQQEYFKDSKVRDENGNLLVMYHGTTEDFTVFDKKKARYSGTYGRGFYFTRENSHANHYGKAKEYYLKINNPLSTKEKTITKTQLKKFLEVISKDEDYGLENYGYGSTVESVLDKIYDDIDTSRPEYQKTDFSILQDVNITAIGDMVAAVELFNEVNGTTFDGFILPTETVIFDSEQAKLTSNKKPTNNPDIRFSLKDGDYLKAVESGDMEAAQKMVDEKAKSWGAYLDDNAKPITFYHGTLAKPFTKFNKQFIGSRFSYDEVGFFFIDRKSLADDYAHSEFNKDARGIVIPAFLKITRPLVVDKNFAIKNGLGNIFRDEDAIGAWDIYQAYFLEEAENIKADGILVKDGMSTMAVVFEPNQIKSSDAVTYDDVGNIIPLSARFNKKNEDIRFSLKETNNINAKDVRRMLEVIEHLKGEFEITKFAKADPKKLAKMTREILKDYSSQADFEATYKAIDELYLYMANGENGQAVWEEAYNKAYEVAQEIINKALVVDDAMYNEYKHLRDYLRNTPMRFYAEFDSVPSSYENFNEFRKSNMGRLKFTRDGMSIDSVYQELSNLYPEFFNAEEQNNTSDQLETIVDVLDSLQPTEINQFDGQIVQASSDLANDLISRFFDIPQAKPTFADKAERRVVETKIKGSKKVEAVRQQKDERIKKLIETQRNKTKKILEKAKASKVKAVEKEKAKRKESLAKMSEREKAKVLRARITRHASELQKTLIKATDKKHIPPELENAVLALLYNINMESNYTYDVASGSYKKNGKGQPTNKTKAFLALKEIYEQIAKNNDYGLTIAPELYDAAGEGVINIFDDVMKLSDKKIADMTSEELTKIYDAIRIVEHSIATANKMFAMQKWESLNETAKAFERSVATRKPKHALTKNHFALDIETPITFFSHFGEAGNELFQALRDAQDNEQGMIDELASRVQSIVSLEQVNKAEKELFEFTTSEGKKLTLSKAHIMDIYLLNKRKQGRKHLLYDPESEHFGNGIHQPEIKSKHIRRDAESTRLTKNDIEKIISKLSESDKAIADKLQKTTLLLAEWGNKACLDVFGYEKFKDPDYWTIKSARESINQTPEKNKDIARSIKNMGSAKAVEDKATNALDIEGVFNVFNQHASDMICYSAWLGVMEDATKLYNHTFRDDNGYKTNRTFVSMLEKYAGEGGSKYYFNLLKDIQNGIGIAPDTATERIYTKLFGMAAKAKVAYKATVVAQQPMAIVRASMILNPSTIIQAITKGGVNLPAWAASKVTKGKINVSEWYGGWERALKYAPIAARKAIGGYEINSNDSGLKSVLYKPETKTGKTIEAIKESPLWAAGKADEITWGILWNACEIETSKNKSLEKGSESYYKETAKLFTKVINETQVVDGVLQRSQLMRSSSGWVKPLTTFKGEPTMALNGVIRAYDNLRYESEPAKRRTAIKTFSRATTVFLVSAVLTAFARSLAVGVTGEDDEYWKKVWKSFSGLQGDEEKWYEYVKNIVLNSDAANNINPLSWLPIASEIMSGLQGYDVERLDVASVGEFVQAAAKFIDSLDKDGKQTVGYSARQVLLKAAEFTGYSPYNLIRDIEGTIRTSWNESNNVRGLYEMEKWRTKPASNVSKYIDILYKAYSTDNKDYEYIYNDLIKSGVDADKIRSGMETRLKKAEGVKEAENLSKRYMSPSDERKYDSSLSEVKTSDVWKSANETQRKEAKSDLYDFLTSDSKEMITTRAEAIKFGVDETEYALWNLAISMADQPKGQKGSGSYDYKEKAEAMNSLNLGDKEIAYFFGKGLNESSKKELNDVLSDGIDVQEYVNFKAAVSDMKADKNAKKNTIPNSKKRKVVNYLNNSDLTDEEWAYFYYEIMGYKK